MGIDGKASVPGKADKRHPALFSRGNSGGCGGGTGDDNGDSGVCRFGDHADRLASGTADDAFCRVEAVERHVADCFVHGVVAADVREYRRLPVVVVENRAVQAAGLAPRIAV